MHQAGNDTVGTDAFTQFCWPVVVNGTVVVGFCDTGSTITLVDERLVGAGQRLESQTSIHMLEGTAECPLAKVHMSGQALGRGPDEAPEECVVALCKGGLPNGAGVLLGNDLFTKGRGFIDPIMTAGGSKQKSTSDHGQAVANGHGTSTSEDSVVKCIENGKPETTLVTTREQERKQEQAARVENEEREREGTLTALEDSVSDSDDVIEGNGGGQVRDSDQNDLIAGLKLSESFRTEHL